MYVLFTLKDSFIINTNNWHVAKSYEQIKPWSSKIVEWCSYGVHGEPESIFGRVDWANKRAAINEHFALSNGLMVLEW